MAAAVIAGFTPEQIIDCLEYHRPRDISTLHHIVNYGDPSQFVETAFSKLTSEQVVHCLKIQQDAWKREDKPSATVLHWIVGGNYSAKKTLKAAFDLLSPEQRIDCLQQPDENGVTVLERLDASESHERRTAMLASAKDSEGSLEYREAVQRSKEHRAEFKQIALEGLTRAQRLEAAGGSVQKISYDAPLYDKEGVAIKRTGKADGVIKKLHLGDDGELVLTRIDRDGLTTSTTRKEADPETEEAGYIAELKTKNGSIVSESLLEGRVGQQAKLEKLV